MGHPAVKDDLTIGRRRRNATDLGLIAALAAGAAVVAGLAGNGFGVPITFQTLAVMLTGLVLGAGRGFAAVVLYVLLGPRRAAHLQSGQQWPGTRATSLPSPSPRWWSDGWLPWRSAGPQGPGPRLFLSAFVTSVGSVHSLGIVGIVLNTKATLEQAFLGDVVFYPGDVFKNVFAAVIAVALPRALPDLLLRRVRVTPSAHQGLSCPITFIPELGCGSVRRRSARSIDGILERSSR